MNAKTLVKSALLALLCTRVGFAQGGPYLVDSLWPQAWPNPVFEFNPEWLDDGVPSTVVDIQTVFVPNTVVLGQKQKDYFWFQDVDKQNGTIHRSQVDNNSCRVWLEWEGGFYPDNGGFSCEFDAIEFNLLDPNCFRSLSGPYCNIPNGVHFVGMVNGYPWVAFGGLQRKMGAPFTKSQIEKILDSNESRNDSLLRSDLRAELVSEFLELFPEINPNDIPVDYVGDELTLIDDNDNTAVVCHILPAIAPEGNGAGRNAYSNAMVVSKQMKDQLTNSVTGTGYMPSDAMILYFEFLADKYGAKADSSAPSKFTAAYIRDWRSLGDEIEYLTEEETRTAMQHAGLIRPKSTKTGR